MAIYYHPNRNVHCYANKAKLQAFPVSPFHLFLSGKLSAIYWTFMSGTWVDSGVWRSSSRAFGRHWILLAPSFSVPITWCVLFISFVLPWVDWNLSLHLLCFFFLWHPLTSLQILLCKLCWLLCLPEKAELVISIQTQARGDVLTRSLEHTASQAGFVMPLGGVSIIGSEIKAGPWVLSDGSTGVCLALVFDPLRLGVPCKKETALWTEGG